MFLSIIIPVYNSEKFISDCLNSCINQNIPINEFEIICIDDCSTDNSLKILKKYKKKHTNIRITCFKENKGVSAARNAGLDLMRGDYCTFLDCDDFLADNCLLGIKHTLYNNNSKSILCVGRYVFKGEDKNRNNSTIKGTFKGCCQERYITAKFIPSVLASKFRFQENVNYGEDELFSLELNTLNPQFLQINKPIYYYRKHNNQTMNLNNKKKIKRLNSAINSAVFVKEKYGLNQLIFIDFFNERINICVEEICSLPFYKSVFYAFRLKSLDLISFSKNDTKIQLFLELEKQRIKNLKINVIEKLMDIKKLMKQIIKANSNKS